MRESMFEDASAFKEVIESIVKECIKKETMSCARVYKAQIMGTETDGNGQVVSYDVQLLGDTQTINLPFSSRVGSSLTVGTIVWVLVLFNNFRNAIVWEKLYFN